MSDEPDQQPDEEPDDDEADEPEDVTTQQSPDVEATQVRATGVTHEGGGPSTTRATAPPRP